MIELRFHIGESPGPVLSGDGVIIATPTGSTAYNVAAGGPIVHSALDCLIITPLAAHSLAFRPIVVPAHSVLAVEVTRANPGTAAVLDGQVSIPLAEGMRVVIRRHARQARLVLNPSTTYWRILLDKLRWAAPPTYRV
jgi:NAD+ kinase